MGEFRKKTAKPISTRFDNITLEGYAPTVKSAEFIPGFYPFFRGYNTIGNILQSPSYQSVIQWNSNEIYNEIEKKEVMFLFQNIEDLVRATDVSHKSLFIDENTHLELIKKHQEAIECLYFVYSDKNSELCNFDFLNNFDGNILYKVCFLFKFNKKNTEVIQKIRMIRAKSYDFISKRNEVDFYFPMVCYVENIVQQLYALSVHCDSIIYDFKNKQINTDFNQFLIENTMISKTIDPFWSAELT